MESSQLALKLFLDELGVPAEIGTKVQRKTLQKGVYLGQVAGVDLGYRFNWYVMGPYSPTLTRDYYALDEALVSGDAEFNQYELQESVREPLRLIKPLLDVPEGVKLSKPDWMELVASVDFLFRVRRMSTEEAREQMQREKTHVAMYMDVAMEQLKKHGLL